MTFYKLMYRRGRKRYRGHHLRLLCVFVLSLSMLSFAAVYCDSYAYYNEAVLLPLLTDDWTCDIRVGNITREQAEQYRDVPYVRSAYIDGNLDFFLEDDTAFETVHRQIAKIFNRYHNDQTHTEDAPTIRVFYGRDPVSMIPRDASTRYATWVIELLLSGVAILAMVLIYRDYMKARAQDIRTLAMIGVEDRVLLRLFGRETDGLYLMSALFGIPLGAMIAYLSFFVCTRVDMQSSNAVYPVFVLRPLSLFLTLGLGYLAVRIAFRIWMKTVLNTSPDAWAVLRFDADRTRYLWQTPPHTFVPFLRTVLRRRGGSGMRLLFLLSVFLAALTVFSLAAVGCMMNLYGNADPQSVAAGIANGSLFLMIAVSLTVYHAIIIRGFVRNTVEACADTVRTLYALGASEVEVRGCFLSLAKRTAVMSLLCGGGLGCGCAGVLFYGFGNPSFVHTGVILGMGIVIICLYWVYVSEMKGAFSAYCSIGGMTDDNP